MSTDTPVTATGEETAERKDTLPPAAGTSEKVHDVKDKSGAEKPVDYEETREYWERIMERRRKDGQSDVLAIIAPRGKLDPIAVKALDALPGKLIDAHFLPESSKARTPSEVEKALRAFIVKRGVASEINNVTRQLNDRRITDGRRAVLRATYTLMLSRLFCKQIEGDTTDKARKELDEMVKDALGLAEKVMLDLEEEKGPLDTFTGLVVDAIMTSNRRQESATVSELVSLQVRDAI